MSSSKKIEASFFGGQGAGVSIGSQNGQFPIGTHCFRIGAIETHPTQHERLVSGASISISYVYISWIL